MAVLVATVSSDKQLCVGAPGAEAGICRVDIVKREMERLLCNALGTAERSTCEGGSIELDLYTPKLNRRRARRVAAGTSHTTEGAGTSNIAKGALARRVTRVH